jgi:Family of unknown function (DUF5752)
MSSTSKLSAEQATAILRELPQEKAFYFYRAVNSPLNVTARSLKELVERVKTIEPTSLYFHLERRDFENWISMLGDSDLSRRIGAVRTSKLSGEALRTKLHVTVKNRVDQLSRLGMRIPR